MPGHFFNRNAVLRALGRFNILSEDVFLRLLDSLNRQIADCYRRIFSRKKQYRNTGVAASAFETEKTWRQTADSSKHRQFLQMQSGIIPPAIGFTIANKIMVESLYNHL